MPLPSVEELARGVRAGEVALLARAITLVESEHPKHAAHAQRLLTELLPATGGAVRVGISGVPGAGKSTFIDALGTMLTAAGKRVAVLAVDPSSRVSGGSILGDKTRMDRLSRHPRAFIRPSPGGGTLGGVASKTQEAMLACEAAGYDVVLVETIGTGQSEVAVHGMVDLFLVLLSPASGDELQGIKRGVMELADCVLIHKADGDLLPAANRAAQQCLLAMHVLHSGETAPPPVVVGSSVTGDGVEALWQTMVERVEADRKSGAFDERRKRQAVSWLERTVRDELLERFLAGPEITAQMEQARARVAAGDEVVTAAARRLLDGASQR